MEIIITDLFHERRLFSQNGHRQGSIWAWPCLTLCPSFYLQCTTEKVSWKLFRYLGLFLKLSHDKARYFCNVFDARTLFPFSYFWFHKFTSENVRRIVITPKTKFISSSRWPNYGRFLSFRRRELFRLKSIRASFSCKNRHLWKRSILNHYMAQATFGEIACYDWRKRVTCRFKGFVSHFVYKRTTKGNFEKPKKFNEFSKL